MLICHPAVSQMEAARLDWVCCVQLAELRAEQNKLSREKVDLENQLEAEQVGSTGRQRVTLVLCIYGLLPSDVWQ